MDHASSIYDAWRTRSERTLPEVRCRECDAEMTADGCERERPCSMCDEAGHHARCPSCGEVVCPDCAAECARLDAEAAS